MDSVVGMRTSDAKDDALLAKVATESSEIVTFSNTECGATFEHIFKHCADNDVPRRSFSWKGSASEVLGKPADKNEATRYKNRYAQTAESEYSSSRSLTGGYIERQKKLFTSGEEKGLMLLYNSQSDEASKKMRVREESA